MMKELNNRVICKELNKCLDETDDLIEKNCTEALACFNFIIWRDNKSCLKKGCFQHPNELNFYCNKNKININKQNIKNGYEGFCCNNKDFCNGIEQQTNQIETNSNSFNNLFIIISILGLIISTLILSLICFIILFKKKRIRKKRKRNLENVEQDITSGSGAGFPLLIERTLTKEIQLETQIGRGKFGDVWCGNYQNRKVAVKIFHTTDYDSWKKETEIYNHYSLASEFILKYLGSDITSSESCTTQFWLVLDYHELGSLYDYLQKNILTKEQSLSIMYSAISGLVHLHDLFEFTGSKPAIAHRDLKSKNLLMKSDCIVCIADFGLSVTSKGIETNKYEYLNIRSGTKRYMPPELLSESIDVKSFKAFQMADIYSFSLLLWEILVHSELNPNWGNKNPNNSLSDPKATNYKPPYYEYIGEDPSFDEMKKIVLLEEKRPSFNFFKDDKSIDLNKSNNSMNLNKSENLNDTHNNNDKSKNNEQIDSTSLNNEIIELNNENDNEIKDNQLIIEICDLIENCWKTDATKRYDYMQIRQRFTQIINLNRPKR